MADVFEVLSEDHAEVKAMLEALEGSPGQADGVSDVVLEARKAVAEQLVIASSGHEAAEEQYFWPAVRSQLAEGDALADEAIRQESQAKELLARLDKVQASDAEFDKLVMEIAPATRAHIAFEESQVWPDLRQVLTTGDARELGEKITSAKQKGPTRPHPHTPASPGVLKAAGPAVAAMDRLRDAVSGRGKLT